MSKQSGEKTTDGEQQRALPVGYEKYETVKDLALFTSLLPRSDSVILTNEKDENSTEYERYEYHPTSGVFRVYFWRDDEPAWAEIRIRERDCGWEGGSVRSSGQMDILTRLHRAITTLWKFRVVQDDKLLTRSIEVVNELITDGVPKGGYTRDFKELDEARKQILSQKKRLSSLDELQVGGFYLLYEYQTWHLTCLAKKDGPDERGELTIWGKTDPHLYGTAMIEMNSTWDGTSSVHQGHTAIELNPGKTSAWELTPEEVDQLSVYLPPEPSASFNQSEQELTATVIMYAFEALQYERWLDFDSNGPASEKVITSEAYAEGLRRLLKRFSVDEVAMGIQKTMEHNLSALDMVPEHSRTEQAHSDLSPFDEGGMTIGKQLLGEQLIVSDTMRKHGNNVNVAPLFGDLVFWNALRGLSVVDGRARRLLGEILAFIRSYSNSKASWMEQYGYYSDHDQEANLLGVMRDHFPEAFAYVSQMDPAIGTYRGDAFRKHTKRT